MRSIHKKTLKRFLSTLLALTMVLGMVPFTALALPAEEKASLPFSKTWGNYAVDACVLKSDVNPNTQSGTQYTTVYVDITPTFTLGTQILKLTIGTEEIVIGDVTTDGSGYITAPTTGTTGTTSGGIAYTIGFNTTPNPTTLEVQATYVPLVGCSTSGLSPTHPTIDININAGTAAQLQVEVPRKAALTVTTDVPSEGITAGQDFTVKAVTDVGSGRVEFEYNSVKKSAAVEALSDGTGYAEYTFTAVTDKDTVTAKQFGMSGGVVDSDVMPATITVKAIPVYRTITFLPGAVGAYIPFSPTTVSVESGDDCAIPTGTPTRPGYVFAGWDSDNDGTVDYNTTATKIPAEDITGDMTLNALWGEPATATVQFNKGTAGGLILQMPTPAKYDEVVGTKFYLPAEPYCEGYTFLGWNDGSSTLAAGAEQTVVAGGNTYTAMWQIKTTTVNYTDADPSDAVVFGTTPTSVNYGSDVTFTVKVPAAYDVGSVAVLKDGALIGWTNKVETVGGSGKLEYTTLSYTFKSEGGTVAITLKSAEGVTFPVMMPTGSDFQAELDTSSDGYETKGYAEVPYGGDYTFSVKAVGEFDLSSITVNGVDVKSSVTPVAGVYTITVNNVTTKQLVEVKTTPKVFYTVTYILGTETFTTQRVEKNTELLQSALPKPTKTTGYNWDGWYTDDTLNTRVSNTAGSGVTVTNDVTLYGKRTPWTGTVKYDLVGSADIANFPNQTKTYGEALTLDTDVPTKEGYNFKGWATAANTDAVAYGKGAQFVDDTWLTEDGTAEFTLYAVWEEKTYTVSVSNGYDYTVHSLTSSVVEHNPGEPDGGVYKFEVTVKSECAQFAPVVTVGTAADYDTTKANGMGTPPKTVVKDSTNTYAVLKTWPVEVNTNANDDGSVTYAYTISNITADLLVNVKVTESKDYSVEIRYWNGTKAGTMIAPAELLYFGTPATTLYSRQWVEYNHYANEPVAPVIEGYTFEGWFKADGTAFDFTAEDNKIVANTTIYAKMVAITPKLSWAPASGDGWTVEFYEVTKGVSGNEVETAITNGAAHTYGSFIRIKLTVDVAYTVDNLSLTANGVLLGKVADPVANDADSDGKPESYTYTFEIPSLEEDTLVKILGIERKTVTVTYNANARDDVSGMPEQHEVVYYINGKTNSTISALVPVRTGYKFLGWNTNPAATTPTHAAGAIADFTTDTTLYAIWEAVGVTASVEVTDATVAATTSTPAEEFEGEDVTLKATVGYTDGVTTKGVSTGKVLFYRVLTAETDGTPLTGALIGSVDANGTTEYTLDVKTSEFKTLDQVDKYYVKYSAESAEGFEDSAAPTAADVATVKVMSKALKWGDRDGVGEDKNVIKIEGSTSTDGKMIAGNTYTLTLPKVTAVFAEKVAGTPIEPKAGIDYEVTWYVKDAKNDWRAITDSKSDTLTWTDYKVGQIFRAEVNAIGATFAKEVEYKKDEAATLEIDTETDGTYKFDTLLYTKATAPTVLQPTTTDLVITGEDIVEGQVYINGALTFTSDHLAQYEKQTVTLKATVVDGNGANVADGGKVYFFRWIDGTNDDLLNETPVLTTNGVAELEDVVISDFDTSYASSIDRFYAVFEANETYDTSASVANDTTDPAKKQSPVTTAAATADCIFIKSAKFQVPVIQSSVAGKVGTNPATETTYEDDLTDLTAGVKITFNLKTDHATAAPTQKYSVVALDGRTVPAEYYDIQWLVTTKANESAPDGATKTTFVVEESKATDMYRVKLTGKEDTPFFNEEKHSMYAKTSALQTVNVKVTVEPDWQYQLNDVVLTAEVKGNGTGVDKLPTGTVKFYYSVDGSKWYEVTVDGKNVSDALEYDENLQKNIATITTKDLPVTETTNTRQNLQITAVYEGDNTFQPSGAFTLDATTTEDTKDGTISTTDGCNVTNDSVTIYSSVVYVNTAVEMSTNAVAATPANGIVIEVTDGHLATFESAVELTLSDIYTLDHQTDAEIAKLAFGDAAKDYSIEWQYTDAKSDYENAVWYKVEGSTNSKICNFTVANDGRAYRAVVTVEDKPITQGSYTAVDQTVAGRQVYYSNILVAQDNQVTVTTNVNTSNTADGYEGIVEGETVTIHTYVAGAASVEGVANNSVTVTIKDSSDKVVYKQTKNDVLGHTSFTWDTRKTWDEDSKTFTDVAMKPGYYTMTVVTDSNNGYNEAKITRQLIIRDNDYTLSVTDPSKVYTYNGKAQGLDVTVGGMDIESTLAQDSVVVYYYDKDGKQVEPTQAGTYTAKIRLQESAYWTEKTLNTTFTIAKRQLSIEDVIVQAKVYDGTTTAYVQEIILKDAATGSNGLPNVDTGVINGDSVFVTGTAETNSADVKDATTVTVTAGELQGDDAANYELPVKTFTEAFKIQRSQVQGDIGASTYKYTGRDIKVDLTRDIYLIDQQGNPMTLTDADVIYYYHSGNGVKKVDAMNWKGMYTVIARPDQNNYKGGASVNVYVGDSESLVAPQTNFKSALISITNTVKLFDGTPAGVTATPTKGSVTSVTYNGIATVPSAAGRYLVKVTTDTNDTAYGIYTVVKAHPTMDLKATGAEYTSAQYNGAPEYTGDVPVDYYTYTGGTIQGVSYTEPTEAGKYVITAHVNETAQYTSHEVSAAFTITEKPLTITADSWSRVTNGTFPDMTATFTGLATGGIAPDTSLRDVQIQPEMIFDGYDNVDKTTNGNFPVTPVAALARNYKITYMPGQFTTTPTTAKPEFAIHGMIDAGNVPSGYDGIAYFGDKIQLYAYGTRSNGKDNTSAVLTWSVTNPSICGTASISQDGLLEVNGVGNFTVTLTRGVGAQKITTSINITALKQEVKVVVPELNTVYNAALQNYTTTKTMSAVNAKGEQVFTGNDRFVINGNTRTDVGSQIVTGKVVEGVYTFQSETYGGLFTINDKEATVAPVGKSVQYSKDLGTLTHTEKDSNGNLITDALSNEQIASIRSDYINLDAGTYEILVAGTEDMNYNVKYTTNPNAEVVTVTALENTLKYTTGVIAGSTGRTSGYLKDVNKFYPDEGAEIDTTKPVAPVTEPNDRMYGEPNPAMNYLFNGLITGDSAADLVELIELVGFVPGIDAPANRAFIADASLTGAKSTTVVAGLTENYTTTTALQADGVKNYVINGTNAFTHGYQNVYQRPFTLNLTTVDQTKLHVYLPLVLYFNGSAFDVDPAKFDKLLQVIKDNTTIGTYQDKGGLAEKLGHTDAFLLNYLTIDTTPGTYHYDQTTRLLTVKLICTNTNYWMAPITWTIEIDPSVILVEYGPLGAYSSHVYLYGMNEHGANTGLINVDTPIYYEIYKKNPNVDQSYSGYKGTGYERRVVMSYGGTPGKYVAEYDTLSAGDYVMFAVSEHHALIEDIT